MDAADVIKELKSLSNPRKAHDLSRFFKTGKGEYGEGDIFIGVMVPQQRKIVRKYSSLNLSSIRKLINSDIHECRLVGLLILVERYNHGTGQEREVIVKFYLDNKGRVNNWDLVDLSAHKILGRHLTDKDRRILYELAKSKSIWDRRISIISTFAFIRNDDFGDSLRIADILLTDKEDLIQKACGWMLREIGKRDERILIGYLDKNSARMPRTMLRYSIERLDDGRRNMYLGRS